MADPTSQGQEKQIPFVQEIWRKSTHMGAMIIPGGYYFLHLSKSEMLSIMIPCAVIMVMIDISRLRRWSFWERFACKIGGKMVRGHEAAGDFTGASYILISVCLTVAMYTKPVAIAAIAFIIVGDTLAALIGRKLGRHRFGRKSVEGSLGCLAGTCLVAWLVPGLTPLVAFSGAVVAAVTEALSTSIDDNITVPIISGLVMTLLISVMGAA
jgi:dolichol kinase